MRTKTFSAMMLVLLTTIAVFGYADNSQNVVEQKEKGSINWTRGVIQAKGTGIPPKEVSEDINFRKVALINAELDASRKIFEIAKEVRIDDTTVVGTTALRDDAILTKIESMANNAKVVRKEYLTDGTVKIGMEMNLRGGFAQLVLPKDIKPLDSITPVTMNKTSQQTYTGLVIDARGLDIRPAMVPKIIDENHQEVYGSAFVSREYAVQQGMSGYGKDLEEILHNRRVSDHPLVVKGLKVVGSGHSEIVISNADASKLRSTSDSLSFLKKCRVVIVID
ncbi:MAG: hypothetical protein WB792_01175 [Desulfobacterales bacterium]